MLICPNCGSKNLKVLDTRNDKSYPGLYRRRLCKDCNIRFSTHERYVDFKDPDGLKDFKDLSMESLIRMAISV